MSRRARSTWGILAAIAFACGGKTDILDETVPDGGGAGGNAQGSGGTSGVGGATGRGGTAGGSAGRGGSLGRGGTLGRGGSAGIPGTGGSAGLGGGSGGAVTGGVGGAGAVGGSAAEVIEAICRHNEAHGCGNESCRTTLRNNYNTNELWGCGDEWLGTQSCKLSDPTPCDGGPFCAEGFALHQRCIDEAEICIRGNHPTGGCVIGCEGWGADCRPSSIGLACNCTGGSRPGIRFETSDACQSEEWLSTVRATCQ
jgi:hypothetical protein